MSENELHPDRTYVWQLVAEGSSYLFGALAIHRSSTVFTSKESAEKRFDRFRAAVTDTNSLNALDPNAELKITAAPLEVIDDTLTNNEGRFVEILNGKAICWVKMQDGSHIKFELPAAPFTKHAVPTHAAYKMVGGDITEVTPLQEHERIVVRKPVEYEGQRLRAGDTGTIVSVYEDGKAFLVEFKGERLVTMWPDQFDPVL